jgi:hypothetical protein
LSITNRFGSSLHGFDSIKTAQAYSKSNFTQRYILILKKIIFFANVRDHFLKRLFFSSKHNSTEMHKPKDLTCTPAGFEPGIFCSVGGRDDHYERLDHLNVQLDRLQV